MDIQGFTQLSYHSCAKEKTKKKCRQNQVDFIHFWLHMNKIKFEIYQQVLRDVYQNFEEDTEEFIKQRNQKIRD